MLALLAPGDAQAKTQRIHGVVLAVTPANGEAVVRHDPFDGMPSMAMPFRVLPRSRVGELLPGNEIAASVDTSTEPWTLRDVVIEATQSVAPATVHVVPLHLGDEVPDTAFVDQTGRPFRFSMLRGQDAVLAFIYTRCRDPRMCPLVSAKFNALQQRIGARRLHLVEVTLDPSYDRPPVLARYGKTFGADPRRWTLAVGDAQPTLDFAARFGVTAFPDPDAGLIHTENTVVIGPDGRIRNMDGDTSWQPADVIAGIDAGRGGADPAGTFDLSLLRAAAVVLAIVAAFVYLAFRLVRFARAKRA